MMFFLLIVGAMAWFEHDGARCEHDPQNKCDCKQTSPQPGRCEKSHAFCGGDPTLAYPFLNAQQECECTCLPCSPHAKLRSSTYTIYVTNACHNEIKVYFYMSPSNFTVDGTPFDGPLFTNVLASKVVKGNSDTQIAFTVGFLFI